MVIWFVTLRHPSPSFQEAIEERSSTLNPRLPASLIFLTSFNSFPCHTYEKFSRNSFPCHTSKNTRLKVLCLPHIQKMAGVGVLLLTRFPASAYSRNRERIAEQCGHGVRRHSLKAVLPLTSGSLRGYTRNDSYRRGMPWHEYEALSRETGKQRCKEAKPEERLN